MTAKNSPVYQMSAAHRDKIKNSNILSALISHAEGEREMTSTQVTAGIALLKKVLPDLQSVQHSGDQDNPINVAITSIKREIVRPGDK